MTHPKTEAWESLRDLWQAGAPPEELELARERYAETVVEFGAARPDLIRLALVDGIHAQHPILDHNEPRPTGQFAQWVEPGMKVGMAGVIDLDLLACDVAAAIAAAVRPEQGLRAAERDEEELSAPESTSTAPEPAGERPAVLCRHCGTTITPAPGIADGWRHSTGYLNCEPHHETRATP